MKIRKVTCIQLGGEFPDFVYRLVMPDYGMPVIATILAEAGHDVTTYIEHVAPPEWDRIAESDLVCFSSLNAGAEKTYRLADRIRRELRVPVVIGGTHATYFPESCLDHVDYVVLGEGDETILDLVATLECGGDPADVAGIAYRENGQVHRTPPRPGPQTFDTIPDFSLIEGYPQMGVLDMIRQRRKPLLTVQASRGCPFKCKFCIVNTMYPTGYRKRDIECVIADMRDKRRYGSEILFVDNDFAAKRPYTKQLLRRIIEEDFGYDIVLFMRVEHTKDDELLSLMREAGVGQIYQGYESIQPTTLTSYDKRQNLDQIVRAVDKLHEYGFLIMGSFVIGADTDTPESIRATIDFVVEREIGLAYFFPLWGHFPEQMNGYETIVPWYRSLFRGWKYADGNFVNHYPMNMRPSELQRLLIEAYDALYTPRQFLRSLRRGRPGDAIQRLAHRYLWADVKQGLEDYLPFLEEVEDGLYGADGVLREDLLKERVARDPRFTFQAGNRAIESLGLSPVELPEPGKRNITCLPPLLDGKDGGEASGPPLRVDAAGNSA